VQACPAAVAALQFDRPAIAGGQLWRLMTGHLVHWSWLHLTADAAAMMGLLYVARGRPLAVPVVLAAGLAVGAAVYLWAPDIMLYRGLSGMNFALLGWVLMTLAPGDTRRAVACMALLAAVVGKVAFEMATGTSPLPHSLPDGVAVVGIAHAAGLAIGVATGAVTGLLRSRRRVYAFPLG